MAILNPCRHPNFSQFWGPVRDALADDFIAPEEITRINPALVYSPETLSQLVFSTPNPELLTPERDILLPGPPQPLSLLELSRLCPDHFAEGEPERWFQRQFARVWFDQVEPGWIVLRRGVVPGSEDKNWSNQQTLLEADELAPNVAELGWALVACRVILSAYPFDRVALRTKSRSKPATDLIHFALDEAGGLVLSSRWAGLAVSWLGLAAIRKF